MKIIINNLMRRISRHIFTFFIYILFSICVIPVLYGRPFRLERLPDMGKNHGCATCHLNPRGGGSLNPFGSDYKEVGIENGDRYIISLGNMDSDKDGFTNDQEFDSGTHPGDSGSRPD